MCGHALVEATKTGRLVAVSMAAMRSGYTATCEAGGPQLETALSWRLAFPLYLQTLAFLGIDVLQLLGFGFAVAVAIPHRFERLAADLAIFQTFGLDALSFRTVFTAALAVVLVFTLVFIVQESVEWRAFLFPEHPWRLLHVGLGQS